jgi:hypothetical protein
MQFFPTVLIPLCVGFVAVSANPRRFQNQLFGLLTFLAAIFLWLVNQGGLMQFQARADGKIATSFPWHRANAIAAAFFPWALWMLRKSIVLNSPEKTRMVLGSWRWLILAACLTIISRQDAFIFTDPITHARERGAPYLLYNIISVSAYIILSFQAWIQMRTKFGLQRFETFFWRRYLRFFGYTARPPRASETSFS